MNSDSKFFIVVVAAAVLAIGAFFVFSGQSRDDSDVADIDKTIGWKIGSDDAQVKIVEFGDFQCPACAAAAAPLKQALENNSETAQLIFRHLPLPSHQNADRAAQAAEAAGLQGKFWEMHDIIFADQSSWSTMPNATSQFESYALSLGLDLDRFRSDFSSSRVIDAIRRDKDESRRLSVNSTPTFFVNGERITGAQTVEQWQQIIDRKLAELVSEREEQE